MHFLLFFNCGHSPSPLQSSTEITGLYSLYLNGGCDAYRDRAYYSRDDKSFIKNHSNFLTMSLEYFTGIEFHSQSGEYKSRPSTSASDAFEMARIGNSRKYRRVTFYVRNGEEILAIPYVELQYLEDTNTDLEEEIKKLAELKFHHQSL